MIRELIEKLFKQYQISFVNYDFDGVKACYAIPSTMATPEQFLTLSDEALFESTFQGVFEQLKGAGMASVVAKQASYQKLTDALYLASVDWEFFIEDGTSFTDFTAFYHITIEDKQAKILSVISHDSSQSQIIGETFNIS